MQLPLAAVFGQYLSDVQLALLIGGVALIYAVRRWRRNVVLRNTRKPREVPSTEANVAANPLNMRAVSGEVQAILADIEETSRRAAAQIENRCAKLERLLVEADEKIRRLEELTQRGGVEPVRKEPSRDAAQMLSRLRQERGAPVASEEPAYAPIYQLADQGKTAREIGQALGRQPGEIELILALRGKQRV